MEEKSENPVTHLDLRTPEEWGKVKGIRILNPDGWRGEGDPSWDTPITEQDYDRRAAESSIDMKVADHSPFYSDIVAEHGTPAGYRAPRGTRRADTAPVPLGKVIGVVPGPEPIEERLVREPRGLLDYTPAQLERLGLDFQPLNQELPKIDLDTVRETVTSGSVGNAQTGEVIGVSVLDQQAYNYAANTISPEFGAALAPGHLAALEAISDVVEDLPQGHYAALRDDEAATADTPDDDGDLEMDDPGRKR